MSLAGLVGRPVLNQAGDEVGRVADLLAQVHGGELYPLVTGLVMRVGRRGPLDASAIDRLHRRSVTLRTARLDLREFQRRQGESCGPGVLDHQLVDTDEIQAIRAADLYLAQVATPSTWSVEVTCRPCCAGWAERFRWHPTPDRVIDWRRSSRSFRTLPRRPAVKLRTRTPRCASCGPPSWPTLEGLGRPPDSSRAWARPGRGRPGGDGTAGTDRAAARGRARSGRRADRQDGTGRGGGRAA